MYDIAIYKLSYVFDDKNIAKKREIQKHSGYTENIIGHCVVIANRLWRH